MELYRHKVQYYETDKMGITHHSNYIRWMEEARIDFLRRIGWAYDRLEGEGIISPVVKVSCQYKKSTTFADEILIAVRVKEFNGVRLIIEYEMKKEGEEQIIFTGESEHCFVDEKGVPVRIKSKYPEFYRVLNECKEYAWNDKK